MSCDKTRIRALNDNLHRRLLVTTGIAALGPEAVQRLLKAIAVFDDFSHANDPHEEHDSGMFD